MSRLLRELAGSLIPLTIATAVTLPSVVRAEPRVGQALPEFCARDLDGRTRGGRDLHGRRTLLVAIADPAAGGAAER